MNRILFVIIAAVTSFSHSAFGSGKQADLSIGQKTLDLFDSTRSRPVKTEVWYPAENNLSTAEQPDYSPFVRMTTFRDASVLPGKYPLIIMSHGTGGGRLTMEWLATGLVKHGYIVAAVDHWGNTFDNKIPEEFAKFWERPRDLSFMITQLVEHSSLATFVDTTRIGAVGFSLGGYSVLALAGSWLDYGALQNFFNTPQGQREASIPELPELKSLLSDSATSASLKAMYLQNIPVKDARVKAIMAIAPALGQGFNTKDQFSSISAPIFIVGAAGDSMAPVATNAGHYHSMIKGSSFYLFEGPVGHYTFLNEAKEELKQQAPAFFTDDPAVNRAQVHNRTISLASKFFNSNL